MKTAYLSVTKKMGCTILAFRNIKYYLKSAANSFARNGIMTIASFVTVTCALFLFGVFLLFAMNLNSVGKQIEKQCELQAYINIEADEVEQNKIYNEISVHPNVIAVELETKEQALNNFKKQLGDNADVLEGLEGQDFLRSSIKITLKDIRKTNETAKQISTIENVDKVKNRQDIAKKIVKFTGAVEKGSAIAMLILLLIAIFIIKNTIKLSVYAREKEIHIMKFVGATDRFIRMPFVFEGIMIGLLGFAVSFITIILGYSAVIDSINKSINMFTFIPLHKCIGIIGLTMAAFGVLMGAIGSGLSLKKHLKV